MIELKEFTKGYSISTNGEVFNNKTNKQIKTYIKNNYEYIRIKHLKFNLSIHRLVLRTFQPIDALDSYVVNHIDGNTLNNKLNNLEWCTQKENIYHSKKISKNGSVISHQKILNLYDNYKGNSLSEFINILLLNCN